jgi:hypothetical protein
VTAGDSGHVTAGGSGHVTAGGSGHVTAGGSGHVTAGDRGPAGGAAVQPAPYSLLCVDSTPEHSRDALRIAGTYVALFLLGAMEGLIGCFQFSHGIGPVPVAALVFCAAIFLTCLLAGAGMGSPVGALAPALGWLLTSLLLTMPTAAGSVIVTNTAAGKWYLYGGAVCAGLGVVLTFTWSGRAGGRPQRAGAWPR